MVKSDLQKLFNQFNKALDRLEEVLNKNAEAEPAFIDAAIQRFEFCFELCWKLIRRSLLIEGISVGTPREAFSEAFRLGWLLEGDAFWVGMIESRNLSSHTYKEEMAKLLHHRLPGYLEAYRHLLGTLENRELNIP